MHTHYTDTYMGFFTPDYNKPGPGIDKNAPEKKRFFLFFEIFFSKLSDLISLNFVYMITMLPLILGIRLFINFEKFPFSFTGDIIGIALLLISIFTSFPATAGFTYVLRNIQRREHAWIIRDMFKHAKLNYKKAAQNGALQIFVYFLLYVSFVTYRYNIGGSAGFVFSCFTVVLALIFMWMQFYVNIMIVTFDLTLKQIYKNSLIFAIGKLPTNFLITLVCSLLLIGIYIYPIIAIILTAAIAFSLLGFITVFWVYPIIDKNMISKSTNKTNGEII